MTATINMPSESALEEVRAGIRVFVRLFGLESDPIQAKYAAGEFEVYDALDSIKILISETSRVIGKRKYVGQVFDFVEDVKQDMVELLLVGTDVTKTAVKRKRNLPLYHLVVSPVVEVLRSYDHASAIQIADQYIDYVGVTAFVEDDYGTYDDALVAREQVRDIIREREEQSKAEAARQRKKNRKAAKLLEAEVKESLMDLNVY